MSEAPIREGARQVMAWLHGWLGLVLGWLLFVMCLAGTLAVFRAEISRWARPETVAFVDPAEATARAIGWLERNAAAAPAWYIAPPTNRANTVDATWSAGTVFARRALDPVTGAPVPRDTLGGEFFYRLHFDLQLPYPWGRLLASLAAIVMLAALITGTIAHRRIFRDFFTFRPGRKQRAWLDAHNALGVLSLPFHFMITLTGLVTLTTVAMPWGIAANYGSDAAKMFAEFAPGSVYRPATGRRVPLAPISPMLRDAERRFGNGGLGYVTIVAPGDAAATVTVLRGDRDAAARNGQQLVYDGPTGRLVTTWTEHGRPAVATYNTLYGLHLAHFAGTLLRWLYALGGAMLTGAVATGLVLWIVKRRARSPLSRVELVVERVNIGVVAGTPIAFLAFLFANRLIPITIEMRAADEVAAVFWSFGVILLLALALPPRLGWTLLLAIGGVGALTLSSIDLVVSVTSAIADGARYGVDLTLLVVAAGLTHAAKRAWEGTPRPRRVHYRVARPV